MRNNNVCQNERNGPHKIDNYRRTRDANVNGYFTRISPYNRSPIYQRTKYD